MFFSYFYFYNTQALCIIPIYAGVMLQPNSVICFFNIGVLQPHLGIDIFSCIEVQSKRLTTKLPHGNMTIKFLLRFLIIKYKILINSLIYRSDRHTQSEGKREIP